jgi:hypothetical protein
VIARLAFSPDNAFPQAIEGGKKYSIDLVSPKMTDSKLLTKQFGEIRVAELTPYETKVLMTDSQVSKVQEFLKAHETSGAKP